MKDELAVVLSQNGLSAEKESSLLAVFAPMFQQAETLASEAALIKVKDADDKKSMEAAREMRLKLRKVRVTVENNRKSLKEDSLRKGKAIDGMANIVKFLVEPIEERLQAEEDFVERQLAERKAALVEDRLKMLTPYCNGVDMSSGIGDMSEDVFQATLTGLKLQHQQRIEAQQKAEAERIAKENALRIENERLRKESEAREKAHKEAEAKAKAEREAIQAKADAERKAREKAEKELADKEAAEAKRIADEKKAAAKAAKAPDAAKLKAFAGSIELLNVPEMSTDEGKAIAKKICESLSKYVSWIHEQAKTL